MDRAELYAQLAKKRKKAQGVVPRYEFAPMKVEGRLPPVPEITKQSETFPDESMIPPPELRDPQLAYPEFPMDRPRYGNDVSVLGSPSDTAPIPRRIMNNMNLGIDRRPLHPENAPQPPQPMEEKAQPAYGSGYLGLNGQEETPPGYSVLGDVPEDVRADGATVPLSPRIRNAMNLGLDQRKIPDRLPEPSESSPMSPEDQATKRLLDEINKTDDGTLRRSYEREVYHGNMDANRGNLIGLLGEAAAQAGTIAGKTANAKPLVDYMKGVGENREQLGRTLASADERDQASTLNRMKLYGLLKQKFGQQAKQNAFEDTGMMTEDGKPVYMNPYTRETFVMGENRAVGPGEKLMPYVPERTGSDRVEKWRPGEGYIGEDGKTVIPVPLPDKQEKPAPLQRIRPGDAIPDGKGGWTVPVPAPTKPPGGGIQKLRPGDAIPDGKGGWTVPNPINSKANTKPPTAAQAMAGGYARRAEQAENDLKAITQSGFDPASLSNYGWRIAPNAIKPANVQQYEQAQRNFVSAVLRKESGAAIAPSELENEKQKYFPQAGDSKEVIEQKGRTRAQAIENLKAEGGAAYDRIPTVPRQGEGGLTLEQKRELLRQKRMQQGK